MRRRPRWLRLRRLWCRLRRLRSKAYERWTPADDEKLEKLFCDKKSIDEIARAFQRQTSAIRARINKLELNIGSLDQLDDSKKCPLFICGIRLALSISGITICDLVNELRELLSGDSYVKWLFDGRLVQAGYFDSNSDSYTRRFLNEEKKVFQVTSVFPHLTRMSVPIEIKSACYEIDLNMLSIEDFGFKAALKQLGVIE